MKNPNIGLLMENPGPMSTNKTIRTNVAFVYLVIIMLSLPSGGKSAVKSHAVSPAPQGCPSWPGQPGWLEQQMGSRERLVKQQRQEAIRLLKIFLKKNPVAPQRADALFRLAGLMWESSEAKLIESMKTYEVKLDDFRSGRVSTRPEEPRIDLKESIVVYEEILDKYPDFEKVYTVLYLYGFALNEQGDEDAALGVYGALLKRFPNSSFVPDAHMAIGEYHFAHSFFKEARKSYSKVLNFSNSPLYDLALYKIAWCYFKDNMPSKAAEYFKMVLKRSKERKETKHENRPTASTDLEREALEDLAFTFSEYGGAKEAFKFMAQVGGKEYSIKVLKKLGGVFLQQARYQEAVQSYKMLVEQFPLADDSPRFQEKIAEAYARSGQMERSLAARIALAQRFGPGSSFASSHKAQTKVLQEAINLSEKSLRFVAMYRHKTAQKTKSIKAYSKAQKAYQRYLKIFPNSEKSPGMEFHLGDVLFKLGRYKAAAKHYSKAVSSLKDKAKKKDAAYAAILSWDKLRQKQPPPSPKASSNPQPLSEIENGFLKSVGIFSKIAPNDKKVDQLNFEVGKIYYQRSRFTEASKILLALTSYHPYGRFAQPAADLALDCFAKSKDWASLEKWSRKFQKKGWFAHKELGKKLKGFIAGAIFQSALDKEKKKLYIKASVEFERVVKEFPKDELAPKALFNSAVSLEKAGEKKKAIRRYKKVIKKYPQKAADALFIIAGVFENRYDYSTAARYYREFAEKFPKDKRAAQTLLQAALLFHALRDFPSEARTLSYFTKAYPSHPSAPDAIFKQAEALMLAKRYSQAEMVLGKYLKKFASKKGGTRRATLSLGLALLAQKKKVKANKYLKRCAHLRSSTKLNEHELEAAAECRFRLGEMVFSEYQMIKLRPPMKRLSSLLKKKAAKLKKAEALFTKVVQVGNMEWASAALFRIGDMYAKFAKAIYEAPLPKSLKPRELEVYKQELQSLAFPVEDKAVRALSISHEMAMRHKYYSIWSKKTMDMLRKLDPARYPPEDEVRPATSWSDSFTNFGLRLTPLTLPSDKTTRIKNGKNKIKRKIRSKK